MPKQVEEMMEQAETYARQALEKLRLKPMNQRIRKFTLFLKSLAHSWIIFLEICLLLGGIQ